MIRRRPAGPAVNGREQHRDWLALVEVDGPFLTLPVLTRVWPTLDALDAGLRDRLRDVHAYAEDKPRAWVEFVVGDLLGWADLATWGPTRLAWTEPAHGVTVPADFALCRPDTAGPDVAPADVYLLGYVVESDVDPRARVPDDDWAATWTDRAAAAARALDVPLALVTNGRLCCLVWAPRGGVTSVVTFDTATWSEAADRVVVRAFRSLLGRNRFTSVPDGERLTALLAESLDAQEEITEELGRGVRRAVEQLVDAMGRWDAREAAEGRAGLGEVSPHAVYQGAVTVLMRLMFLFFAEERGLLPADNPVYAAGYGVSILCERLEADAQEAGEEGIEFRTGAWLQLLATSAAVYRGVRSDRLRLEAYDGSLFDPSAHPWLAEVALDDRTLLHVLRAVQYVVIRRERRRVSFRTLEVEQIGYVYEGLLGYDAVRAEAWVLGLIGSPGLEEEVPLPDLEGVLAAHTDLDTGVLDRAGLAADLAERFRDSRIGSVSRLTTLLAPPTALERSRRLARLLAVTEGDRSLAERILPLAGLLRDDLRGLPSVVPAGALYVTTSAARAKSGTHYTPRTLAEEVTETALLPLVHGNPGPLDTDDQSTWVPATAEQILSLKVADIAMGSGAFLVAACRFLAGKLVEARSREGDLGARDHLSRRAEAGRLLHVDGLVDEVVIRARREVIEHCLYGADINPMAVEMAKLSLWLVSMDPGRPFTFLDDRLVAGDSLLGIASLDQLECLHLHPEAGRRIHGRWDRWNPTEGVRALLADLARERTALAALPGESLAELQIKRDRLGLVERMRWRLDLLADSLVGSSLATASAGPRGWKIVSKDLASLFAEDVAGQPEDSEAVAHTRAAAHAQLNADLDEDADERHPLHWPLEFPEVFERGGFDTVVGNPPFLGGKKISGAMGSSYRDFLLHGIGGSVRGNADLVAYFVLRAHQLLGSRGQTGLIATNTLAQGDTREVGLDQLTARGVTVRAAVKSEPWPSRSAVLQYSAVWTSRAPVRALKVLDGVPVATITPSLDAGSRVTGNPYRLAANSGIAFQGSTVLGMGFTMPPQRAQQLIEADPRNAEVLFPYLNGEDLNSRPDHSARRWVINFHDWPEERARSFSVLFAQVERLVKPERQASSKQVATAPWWLFWRPRSTLKSAIAHHARVTAITRVSSVVMPVTVPTGQVFADRLIVFASDTTGFLALLNSAAHYHWAIAHTSTLETRINYSPTDAFETFARPELTEDLQRLGDRLDCERRDLMLGRQTGLTATYNLVHDPGCTDADVVNLREIHRAIDHATFAAYGWADLDPTHDHHETRQGIRWTVGPVTRQEMLDRLLELNHQRYAAEQGTSPTDDQGEGALF